MVIMGEKLKKLRVDLGWTLRELARQSGVDAVTVSRAEKGLPVQAPTAKAIADAFSRAYGREIKPSDIEDLKIE